MDKVGNSNIAVEGVVKLRRGQQGSTVTEKEGNLRAVSSLRRVILSVMQDKPASGAVR